MTYERLLTKIITEGVPKSDRTGVGTLSLFGEHLEYDLSTYPLITTKPVSFYNIVTEMLWFLRSDDNIKFMVDRGCNIWNKDAYSFYCKRCDKDGLRKVSYNDFVEEIKNPGTIHYDNPKVADDLNYYTIGDTGEQYPRLWRKWKTNTEEGFRVSPTIDQIANLINGLKNNPFSRRHIVTAWNPATIDDMALPSCHSMFQFNVRIEGNTTPHYVLDCQLYQRSSDVVLGLPYNIASYSLLTCIIAAICDMVPGKFYHTLGDVHIYNNHIDAAKEQISREPYDFPKLYLSYKFINSLKQDIDNVVNFEPKDLGIVNNYKHHPKLSYPTPLNT